ncbi:hypothetical protein BBAD15_g2263 [Beauveria bassiana D1-5]|uniref:Uncharacterized protein n=1 Tax=Beauveria bassiana D1-5 TaxID=1245745 RepID=A0A0A2WFS5_BEABA|nr:hypothetical protein BBAD15_g2263 [Beauveria bassiana D1-5]
MDDDGIDDEANEEEEAAFFAYKKNSQLDRAESRGRSANRGIGRRVPIPVVPAVIVASTEEVFQVVGAAAQAATAKQPRGEDGAGRKAAEPEQVLVNIEDEDGPIVEGAGGA